MNTVNEGLKYYARKALQVPSIYSPCSLPHSFLFSTRRSGSTLLRDMIYSQPGFNYVDQPFDTWQYNPYLGNLPNSEMGQHMYLDVSSQKKFQKYVDMVLSRQYIIRSQWQIWQPNYHWKWERYVVKILSAKNLMPWFQDTWSHCSSIVYLVRHPVPVALSIMNRNWGLVVEAYLNNEWFVETELSHKQQNFAWDILRSGSRLEQHVLEWCLENKIPLQQWRSRSWLTVSYEKLLSSPDESVARVCNKLKLEHPNKMLDVLKIPSRTAVKSSRENILQEGSSARLGTWQQKIDNDMRKKISQIFDKFELEIYQADRLWAIDDFDSR